jgi:osmotically-inducible protein OsmY
MMTMTQLSKTLSVLACAVSIGIVSPAIAKVSRVQEVNPVVLAEVQQALNADPVLRKYGLEVRADRDAVVLWGSVSTAFDRERAVKVASNVQGYRKLEDVIHLYGVNEPNMGP